MGRASWCWTGCRTRATWYALAGGGYAGAAGEGGGRGLATILHGDEDLALAPRPPLRHRTAQGTLLRTALALGWTDVVLLPGCCDPGNDKCLRASQGASLRLRLVATEDAELAAAWKATGRVAYAAMVPEGTGAGRPGRTGSGTQPLPSQDLAASHPNGVALVLGAEGRGLSASLACACRHTSIPMVPGSVQSLNVAVAGAILMAACSSAWPCLEMPRDAT